MKITSGRVALVLSGLALLIALGGTAYAVNTVRSSDIVDGAVRSVDIRNGAVGTVDAAAASLGRSPRLWAQIGPAGNVVGHAGNISANQDGTGQFTVTFPRDVSSCALSITPYANAATMSSYTVGTTDVAVYIFDGSGNAVDLGFDIVAFC
jgi:hypothetical protein